jgi:hypothetical protein
MNTLSQHISFTELADLAEERSTSAEALQHLAACTHCSSQLQAIRQTVGLMKSDAAEDAPAEVIDNAKRIFRQGKVRHEPSLVARVVAALTFDSFTNEPAFGLRSATSSGRQLVYSTQTADIDLRVAPEDEKWMVAGQILGSDCASGEVKLEGNDFAASAELNELCEFSFQSVPDGDYKLVVRMAGLIIETPQIELRL